MATLACVYDAEPAPRRPHDVIAPPGGRHGHRKLRPGPKAKAKWLAGSVEHDPAEVIAAAFDQAGARDPARQRTWVVLVDGAEHQLGLIRAEAARRGITISILIDLIHVLGYIWKAAWSLHTAGDPAAADCPCPPSSLKPHCDRRTTSTGEKRRPVRRRTVFRGVRRPARRHRDRPCSTGVGWQLSGGARVRTRS